MTTLVLITESYPFDGAAEHTFLAQEIPYLGEAFDRVFLVPAACNGKYRPLEVSDAVVEDLAYAKDWTSASRIKFTLRGVFSKLFVQEVFSKSWLIMHPKVLLHAAAYLGRALGFCEWLKVFIQRHELQRDTVFYTYWFSTSTLGLGLFRKQHIGFSVVTRAHGADLYEKRHSPPYIPYRQLAMSLIDRVFPDSDAGVAYLRMQYPEFVDRIKLALLGVADPGVTALRSNDGVFRVVSCSYIVGVKRLHLLVHGLASLAAKRPDLNFEWTHFGDGPEKPAIEILIRLHMGTNIKCRMLGHQSLSSIYRHYASSPVDVFINVSASEGTPVSIMEAISFGLPIIATAVGGNSEIVSPKNGILLSPNPSKLEIAAAIERVADDKHLAAELRFGSKDIWKKKYQAKSNYMEFCDDIMEIAHRRYFHEPEAH